MLPRPRDTPAMDECPLCARIADGVARSSQAAVAFADRFPVADGHTLVVPRRHVSRVEQLGASDWSNLFALVREVACDLAAQPDVEGVNIGANSGPAAGQTIEHAHVHVIPRRWGDVADPRGGIRRVIPERADYWSNRD
jgi:diadenosine tetraphosphate (Ap4A) HIT family hydrolase